MSRYAAVHKNPEADMDKKSKRWIEWCLLLALSFATSLFFAFQKFENEVTIVKKIDAPIDITHIPPTTQYQPPPQPPKPVYEPIASDDDDFPEDIPLEFDNTDANMFTEELPPPPEEEDPIVPFHALSKQPKEIHRVNPVYPELARKAEIEGTVVIKVLVNTKGEVEEALILKSITLLDKAALDAAKQFRFSPGKQRNRLVKVWVSIPFNFKIR
ncbi:MAG: energy transducer TonB [Calditrichia bacterium]